ncbi:hypothetical protein B0P06_001780 [Clostridium saccharoperbutylacetonicum]|uniref:DUF2975 domain-containing protein n=1 Tax=Clostridium saccharoperbutylacetonicum N1-4(HMT) TaxID=931276 RepID=M1M879_9CLOT|nr:DUF2975 domain-containing protein [Clostridium saccharoperbutylacetonicum]AGF54159.1 hypothetical protein Cspa_c03410 [Clostridium saccharoperbutylacetonicum N1-4(HMT)]NRT59327.1 hypothetical protein [Clostridium saccharoperbutylacetonicum]NSB28518.1 hypothetical protein [Clostridium saccharoperbutylacetonicum]NSB42009.1 hypothetical protein [Clostridium saccharoperbutylacetonicum]
MKLKADFLSKILYVIISLGLIVLTAVIIGLPWVMPIIFNESTFYSIVNHTSILVLLYLTGIPTWIILWMTKKLAENIIKREPFSDSSIFSLKFISICSIFVFICYLYTCVFLSATLGTITIAVGAFMVSLISTIIYKLVEVAVEIQRENELTI